MKEKEDIKSGSTYKKIVYRLFYHFLILVIGGFVVFLFITNPGINGYKKAMFPDMIYGHAYKPFTYRVLVPYSIRIVSNLIPFSARIELHQFIVENIYMNSIFMQKYWHIKYLVEYFIAVIFFYFLLLGFSLALRYLMTGIYSVSEKFQDVMIIVSLLLLPGAFKYYSYIYDFATLLLFTLALAFMVRQCWVRYGLVFILACLNKETTILLLLIFIIHFYKKKIPFTLYKWMVFGQLVVFSIIRMGLIYIFKDNRGRILEFHLLENFGKRLIVPLILGALIYLGITFKWKEKPKFLKDGLWILIPLVLMGLFFGFFDELRGYYEVYPVIFCLVTHSIAKLLNVNLSVKNGPSPGS